MCRLDGEEIGSDEMRHLAAPYHAATLCLEKRIEDLAAVHGVRISSCSERLFVDTLLGAEPDRKSTSTRYCAHGEMNLTGHLWVPLLS